MSIASFVVSMISIIVAIISIIVATFQNRKLHNENIGLSTMPLLNIDLLFDRHISGQIVKKEYAFDRYNVWESEYTPYYVDNEVYYDCSNKALFTINITNVGKGIAEDIKIIELVICFANEKALYNEEKLLFESCALGERKANKIYINQDDAIIEIVELSIKYTDVLMREKKIKYIFQKDKDKAMLKYVKKEGIK